MAISPPTRAESAKRGWGPLTFVGGAISALAPFLVALSHAGTGSVWRDDGVVLRGIGWVGWSYSGCVSALLAQAAYFLPIGPLHFRVAVVSALVLGAAGLAVHALTRDLLARHADAPLLTDALAPIAALTATLSATGQSEGAVAGGGGVALLLAVLLLRAEPWTALEEPGRAVPLGMLAGALLAESGLTAAVAVGAGIAVGRLLAGERSSPRGASFALGGGLATAALLVSPAWLRAFAAAPFLDIGRAMRAVHDTSSAMRPVGGAFGRLIADGPILLGVATFGFGVGWVQRRLRAAVVPLVVVILLHAVSALVEGDYLAARDIAPLHLVATAALAIGVGIAVQAVATALLHWQLPMAKGASILLVMTDLTLAVASAEEASFASDRSTWRGAEAFTDQALEQLPPGAILLLRSRQAAWRLWAAQLAHGSRPDVIVVPAPGTGDTRLALRLLRAEPALQKALQDISLEGRPGEEALTILADARPVLGELDPGWDRRVYSHLVPERAWLRFAPEPRGPSDRKAAYAEQLHVRGATEGVMSAVPRALDPDSAVMAKARLLDSAVLAALLGDREEAKALASVIGDLPEGKLAAAELMQRLLAAKAGPVEVRGLLR